MTTELSPQAELNLLRASLPRVPEEVDEWLRRYMAAGEAAREEARRLEALHDAAPAMLEALQAMLDGTDGARDQAAAAIAAATGAK